MIVKELRISNILSFKYVENIHEATKIEFSENLNIFIGENGSGKSTALEVINFIFKKVLFLQFPFNDALFEKQASLPFAARKQIISPINNPRNHSALRLAPNWNTPEKPQKILLAFKFDELDLSNLRNLVKNLGRLKYLAEEFSGLDEMPEMPLHSEYFLEITLNQVTQIASFEITPDSDTAYLYLFNLQFLQISNKNKQRSQPDESNPATFRVLCVYRRL